MTHWRLGRSVWNSRRIVGMATFRIVLSSTGMATDTITTAAANQRFGSRSGGPRSAAAGIAGRFAHARILELRRHPWPNPQDARRSLTRLQAMLVERSAA